VLIHVKEFFIFIFIALVMIIYEINQYSDTKNFNNYSDIVHVKHIWVSGINLEVDNVFISVMFKIKK